MTKAFLKAYSIIPVMFAGAIMLALIIGSLRSRPVALQGLDDCELPCWNGLTPGQNNVDRAIYLLSRAGYVLESNPLRWRYMTYRSSDPAACRVTITYDSLVFLTELSECAGVTLGDVLAILGQPEGVVTLQQYDAILFRDGRVAVIVPREGCEAHFSPYAPIDSIQLRAQTRDHANPEQPSPANPQPWHGFASRGYYAQLEPVALAC